MVPKERSFIIHTNLSFAVFGKIDKVGAEGAFIRYTHTHNHHHSRKATKKTPPHILRAPGSRPWSAPNDGGPVIDVSDMRRVQINMQEVTATVQDGINQAEIVRELWKYGFTAAVSLSTA
jgi:fatty-acid desaturase